MALSPLTNGVLFRCRHSSSGWVVAKEILVDPGRRLIQHPFAFYRQSPDTTPDYLHQPGALKVQYRPTDPARERRLTATGKQLPHILG